MRLDKVVLRAVVTTLAVIMILCAFMLAALSFVFPSTMMQITYNLGMNNISVSCAKRAYAYSGEVEYIAFATELAMLDGNTNEVIICGNQLIKDDEFSAYCQDKNASKPADATGTYEQYVIGQICLAEYDRATDTNAKKSVIEKAFDAVENNTFPKANPVALIILSAKQKADTVTLALLKAEMESFAVDNLSEDDAKRFNELFALTNG